MLNLKMILLTSTYALFLGISLGCGKFKNTNSADQALYGFTNAGGPEFKAAFPVLAKNCTGCHSQWNSWNETDFVTNGLIMGNSPEQSPIYFRIKDNDVGIAGDMPTGSAPLSATDIALIKTWVQVAQ